MDKHELTLLRLRAGLKQFELAERLHVPQTIICDLERGRRPITPDIEAKIKNAIKQGVRGIDYPGPNNRLRVTGAWKRR